jgi:hypothetical protein
MDIPETVENSVQEPSEDMDETADYADSSSDESDDQSQIFPSTSKVSDQIGYKSIPDKKITHIYAKIKQPPPKKKQEKKVENSSNEFDSVGTHSPVKSKSRSGRLQKTPGYLKDYTV